MPTSTDPQTPASSRRGWGLSGLGVFAVEDRSVQLAWSCLPSSGMTLQVGDSRVEVGSAPPTWYRGGSPSEAGPGAASLGGLEPGTRYEVLVSGGGRPRRRAGWVRTLEPPPGEPTCRFATIGDCHIGESHLGLLRTLHDPRPLPPGLDPYPWRAAVAAISEAQRWGAELIVVKGDLTSRARPDELEGVADVLATSQVPVAVVLGNHDVRDEDGCAAARTLAARGFPAGPEARALDLAGVRLVLGHSPVAGRHSGRLAGPHIRDLVDLAGSSAAPVVLALHHPPMRWPLPTHYPPSISRPDSKLLVGGLARANAAALILAGHSHRNRRYRVGGVTVSEVGSTKDYPGQWAGYAVHEGGIRQVVARTARPDVICWTQMTARALGGLWGRWSPGSLEDRCWTMRWPEAGSYS